MVPDGRAEVYGPDGEIPGDVAQVAMIDEGFVEDQAGLELAILMAKLLRCC